MFFQQNKYMNNFVLIECWKSHFLSTNNFFYTLLYLCDQGLYIRYRDLSGGSQNYNIITTMDPMAKIYVIGNLKKFTRYEFFIAPFYRNLEGQPSNSKIIQTFEDGK